MDSIVCWVCRRRIPSSLKNAHHAKPQAVGGGPEDEVDLCAGCHHNLHRIADMLGGPRASQAQDTVTAAYSDDLSAGHRCMELAVKVTRHMGEKESGQYRVKPHEDVEVLIELPLAVKNALMLIGRESRDPHTNRRVGMAGVARRILIDAVLRKFPALAAEIKKSTDAQHRQNPDAHYARPRRRVREKGETFNVEASEQKRPPQHQKG